jgi:hypothetical protein
MSTTPTDVPVPFTPNLDAAGNSDRKQEAEAPRSPPPAPSTPSTQPAPPPASSEPEFSLSESDVEKRGAQIAMKLDEDGYHPVVIVGTSSAGKSCLLCSLFAYLRSDPSLEIGVHLNEPLLERSSPYGELIAESSEAFFHRAVQEFIEGTAQPSTEARVPFFIPVVVRPRNGPAMKFAFLESRGEWYQPRKNTSAYFQPLKGEIESVLKHFQRGVSVIYVAPYSVSPEVVESGLALVGAMNGYESARLARDNDAHMLLVTKWDSFRKGSLGLKDILTNTKADAEEYVNSHYKNAFAVFKGLALQPTQLSLMQYCSGLISGRTVIRPSDEIRPAVNRYPRRLWNWLYLNATRTSKEPGYTTVLIPDPPPPRPSILQWLHELVSRIVG